MTINTLKHVVVDGGLAFIIGSTIDAIFARVHQMPDQMPTEMKPTLIAIAKTFMQAFVTIAVGVEASNFVYPEAVGDDPTNGFWMLYVLMMSSPHLQDDLKTLSAWHKSYVQTKLFSSE